MGFAEHAITLPRIQNNIQVNLTLGMYLSGTQSHCHFIRSGHMRRMEYKVDLYE